MKLHITKSVGNDEYLCPNCGARVKYSPQRMKLAIHNLPLTPGKRCPTAKLEAELNLDPEGPMPELLKLEERPLGRVSYMRNQTRIAASTTPARYVTASLS